MKTIFQIFRNDLESIGRHFFVIVIVVAISILPALYAWVNIYANWDPYVNTGRIPVAAASRDPGQDLADGRHVNAAEDILDELEETDSLGWEIVKRPEDAIRGVRSGKYYAAVIFEDNFTYNMYHLEKALVTEDAPLTYYANAKKNAVATKITDTASASLQEKINTKYMEAVFDQTFEDAGSFSEEADEEGEDAVDDILKQLRETRDALADFDAAIELFSAGSGDIEKSLKNAEKDLKGARSKGRSGISKATKRFEEVKTAAENVASEMNGKLTKLDDALSELEESVAVISGAAEEEKQKLAEPAIQKTDKVLTILQDMRALIPDDARTAGAKAAAGSLDTMILHGQNIRTALSEDDPDNAAKAAEDTIAILKNLRSNELKSGLQLMVNDIQRAIEMAEPLLSSTSGLLDDISPVLDSAGDTVSGLDTSLTRIQTVIRSLEERLNVIIDKVEPADKEDRAALLTGLLNGDSDEYSSFFASLSEVKTEEIYAVKSYGAAMTPFYSILAIWVGGVMLVSLLRTNVNRKKFPQITEAQGFFGRFLIFFLIGQVQAAVIVAGDIFLLGCEPQHPWLMWIAAAVTSMVFTMFIYAIAMSFGDIGKAIVVVIMVLQIAGSSGSFPIEILPLIYSKIYRFFPFPYAINAMREALCGTYGYDFIIYLAELMVFFAAGILIGLLIRRPFIGMNRFIMEKLEETEVL